MPAMSSNPTTRAVHHLPGIPLVAAAPTGEHVAGNLNCKDVGNAGIEYFAGHYPGIRTANNRRHRIPAGKPLVTFRGCYVALLRTLKVTTCCRISEMTGLHLDSCASTTG